MTRFVGQLHLELIWRPRPRYQVKFTPTVLGKARQIFTQSLPPKKKHKQQSDLCLKSRDHHGTSWFCHSTSEGCGALLTLIAWPEPTNLGACACVGGGRGYPFTTWHVCNPANTGIFTVRGSGSTVIGVYRVVVIAGDSSSRPRLPAMKSFPARLATSEEWELRQALDKVPQKIPFQFLPGSMFCFGSKF